jgi:hypothetical protein
MAGLEHDLDEIGRAREHGLNRSIPSVSNPAFEPMQLRQMLRSGAKTHALDAAMDQDMESSILRHHPSAVGMAGKI